MVWLTKIECLILLKSIAINVGVKSGKTRDHRIILKEMVTISRCPAGRAGGRGGAGRERGAASEEPDDRARAERQRSPGAADERRRRRQRRDPRQPRHRWTHRAPRGDPLVQRVGAKATRGGREEEE